MRHAPTRLHRHLLQHVALAGLLGTLLMPRPAPGQIPNVRRRATDAATRAVGVDTQPKCAANQEAVFDTVVLALTSARLDQVMKGLRARQQVLSGQRGAPSGNAMVTQRDAAANAAADIVNRKGPEMDAYRQRRDQIAQCRDEAFRDVLFTSPLDHLGIGTAVDGDAIYTGAFDNASGCALLLEVARAFSQVVEKPRRSVLFAAVTAEEQALVGLDYLAHHLPVPLEKIVAIVNVDGAIPLSPGLRDVVAFGGEPPSLGLAAAQAAVESGFEVSPDPYPDQGIFVRTDHYPFVEQGVPALYFAPGYRSNDRRVEALEAQKKWLVTRYHSPKDDA